MSNLQNYHADCAIHPGETLKETLYSFDMSKRELAQRTNVTEKHIGAIIGGRSSISPEFALKLEKALSVSADFWNSLERNYQSTIARLQQVRSQEKEYVFLDEYKETYQELARLGIVEKYRWCKTNYSHITNQILDFFGIASLSIQDQFQEVAFRRYDWSNVNKKTISAMIRLGEKYAVTVSAQPYNEKELRKLASQIPRLSRKKHDEYFPILEQELASVGIVLVCIPGMKNTGLQGVSKWIAKDKAMIILKTKGQTKGAGIGEDKMWFSLLHEICHILNHGRKQTFVDLEDFVDSQEEQEANRFAAEHLMPGFEESDLEKYKSRAGISAQKAIVGEASRYGVSQSIVAGQLGHRFQGRQRGVYAALSEYKRNISYVNCL